MLGSNLDKSRHVDVLVVDDEEPIIEQLVECFRLAGVSCASSVDAINALQMISEGLRPAIVLSDLRMPELDGLSFAARLGKLSPDIRPELIFISGHATLQDAIEAIRLGARDLLVKPVDRDKLLRSISTALAIRENSRNAVGSQSASSELKPSTAGASTDDQLKRQALEALRGMRKMRRKFLPEELFSDPCWEMLLDLYEARLTSTQVTITALGVTSGVPLSTALRRIGELQAHGLIERVNDQSDKRRTYVSLTDRGLVALDSFFDAYSGRSAA